MSNHVTVSGRITNLMTRRLGPLTRWFSRRHARQFERSAGAKGGVLGGKPVFRLTVVGRRSGEARPVMLMLVRRGDDLLVCGSQGGSPDAPNWWLNLVAAGAGVAQVGGETFEVDARVVTGDAERAEAWMLLVAAYPDFASYQELTDRVLPIAVLSRSQR